MWLHCVKANEAVSIIEFLQTFNAETMLMQLKFILWLVIHLPVLPILAFQGYRLKKAIPLLPVAAKNVTGSYGHGGKEINIIAIGESAFAGVGVEDHSDGVAGQIAKALSEYNNMRVNWSVLAESGYNVRKVRNRLVANLSENEVDLIVIGLGANDTFELNSPRNWFTDFKLLIYAIRLKQPTCPIIISPLPPVGEFPAFSKLMKQVFGTLVAWHSMALKPITKECDNVYYMDKPIKCAQWLESVKEAKSIYHFFSDGIHPSPLAYYLWGNEVAKFIITNKLV